MRRVTVDIAVDPAALWIDLGGGPARHPDTVGGPDIFLDRSVAVLDACRRQNPDVLCVQGDVEHLPIRRGSVGGARWWMTDHRLPRVRLPLALWEVHRILAVGSPLAFQMVRTENDVGDLALGAVRSEIDGWAADRLTDVLTGAGFEIEYRSVVVSDRDVRLRATRARTLADTVGEGMRLLVCGVNPSPYSADVGVGYGRPGNRFWPAALAAGIVSRDRDPVDALLGHHVGMTDFVKRATRQAAEVTADEYHSGLRRVERLVRWLQPGAVCFVGLSGWRTVVNGKAAAGLQTERIGGRPAYVMPSTSGLNAHSSPAQLAAHLEAAWELGGG